MKKTALLLCICFALTFSASNILQAQEVDYGTRFYKIEYDAIVTNNNCPDADSVEILDIYGNVFYRGRLENARLMDDDTKLMVKNDSGWTTYDIHGRLVDSEESKYTIVYSKDSLLQGLADAQGKIVIPVEYEEIEERFDFIPSDKESKLLFLSYVFKKNGKWGLLDESNRVFLPFKYDGIDVLENDYGERMLCLEKNEIMGFANVTTGKIQTDFVFSEIEWDLEYGWFNGHVIPAKNSDSGLWGYINYNGKMIVPCKYKNISVSYSGGDLNWKGLALTAQKENNLWDVLDVNGKEIVLDCQEVYCDIDSVYNVILVKKKDKWFGVNPQTGKTKYSFGDNTMSVRIVKGNYAVIEQNDKKGVLNILSGKIIIPCLYEFIHLNKDYDKHEVQYAACMNYEENTILDYFRLKDGDKTHSYSNYRGKRGSSMVITREGINYSWVHEIDYTPMNGFVAKSGYICIVSSDGRLILDESYQIQGDVRVFKNYIVTNKGVFDKTGKLIFGNNYELKCYDGETFCILYNKGTQKREYYVFDEGVLHEVDGYDGISRYYYTQCQEKFRNQPSDVDKNVPVAKEKKANTYAFIIANEEYSTATNVPFALNDGRSFKEYCEKTLGILPNHIKLYENATSGQVITCVEQMKYAAAANNGDINIIFYYAGHAFSDEDKNACMLPTDGDASFSATGYSLNRLYDELGRLPANSIICFIDACYSGTTRDEKMLKTGRAVIVQPKAEEPRGNMVVFAASTGKETAHQYQAKKHGMFTYYLLKKLQESKGDVSLGELSRYLVNNVKKMSFEINEKPQTPTVSVSPTMKLEWESLKLK